MDDRTQDKHHEPTAKPNGERNQDAGGTPARGTTIGPTATTKTLDREAAQGSSTADAEAAKLSAKIQADAQMKFSARTTDGKFRAPRSKGK
jgi:hypothetical protein